LKAEARHGKKSRTMRQSQRDWRRVVRCFYTQPKLLFCSQSRGSPLTLGKNMNNAELPVTFVRYAADILGETQHGLTGTKIIESTTAYAVQFGINVPHTRMSISSQKRSVLYDNLLAFTASQRYQIIKELCDHPSLGEGGAGQRKKLKILLISKYNHLDPAPEASDLNQGLIDETRHWLSGFPESLLIYNEALAKYSHGAFSRNVLDDMRLGLEKLLHSLFENHKTLENQRAAVGGYIKDTGGSAQLSNMFASLLSYYCQYQNDYVKHDDAVKEEEIEFIIEITSSFMKHLIKINKA
jgi:hypothetical protein